MKTIGLIGGMSWESTATYYKLLNEEVKAQLGGLHSAKIVMMSVDFAEIEKMQMQGDWDAAAQVLSQAAVSLQSAGADFFLICTNTMHKVAEQVQSAVAIPLLHIADATGSALVSNSIKSVGLLGTAFTMEQDFYKGRLIEQFDLDVVIPNSAERQLVHRIIYEELCLGKIENRSKQQYLDVVHNLVDRGAQAIILGCTEISLLISAADTEVPLYDTTSIHAHRAVNRALNE